MIRFLCFGVLICMCTFSCKTDSTPSVPNVSQLLETAKKDPSADNQSAYYKGVNEYIKTNLDNKESLKPILQDAADFSISQNQVGNSISYLFSLVRNYKGPSSQSNLLNLSKMMSKSKKTVPAEILYRGYKEVYPDASPDVALEKLIQSKGTLDSYIDTIFQSVFADPDEYGLNRNNALKYVDVAEAYALAKPDSEQAPENLYKAAEIARSIRTIPKALTIYDWLIEKYPSFDKSATVLFLKGFILENDVKDSLQAKQIYEQFIEKHPTHELASSVKFLLENIGKSDEEILNFLEGQQK